MTVEKMELVIPLEYEECRVDKCVSELMGDRLSRSAIQKLIKSGELLVNGTECKTSTCVQVDDVVSFMLKDPIEPNIEAQDIPLGILYEDEDLLIVDKPKGMVVHPAPGHGDGTLVNALLHHCGGRLPVINGEERPGIVHRLDQFTSGLLAVAKTDAALRGLAAQFQGGGVHKTYLALVHGIPRPATGHVETLIGRSPTDRKRMAVVERNGRPAVTDYRTADIFLASDAAMLEVEIATGRTHQIRVHLRHVGHPVAGDPVYGNARRDNALGVPRGRQFLHAWRLRIAHPTTGKALAFETPPPEDFEAARRLLKGTGR